MKSQVPERGSMSEPPAPSPHAKVSSTAQAIVSACRGARMRRAWHGSPPGSKRSAAAYDHAQRQMIRAAGVEDLGADRLELVVDQHVIEPCPQPAPAPGVTADSQLREHVDEALLGEHVEGRATVAFVEVSGDDGRQLGGEARQIVLNLGLANGRRRAERAEPALLGGLDRRAQV